MLGMFIYGYDLSMPRHAPDHVPDPYAAIRTEIEHWGDYGGGFVEQFGTFRWLGYALETIDVPDESMTAAEIAKAMTLCPGAGRDYDRHMEDFYSQEAFSPEFKAAIRAATPDVFLIWEP